MEHRWNFSSWAPLPAQLIDVPLALVQKIFIHPLPDRWNGAVDARVKMKHGVYLKFERVFHEYLSRSHAVATSATAAMYIFVPIYTSHLGSNEQSSSSSSSISSLRRRRRWPRQERRRHRAAQTPPNTFTRSARCQQSRAIS